MVVLVMKLITVYSLYIAVLFVCSMHLGLGGNETDKLALLAIKAQIKHDPYNVMSSWNESIHFCSWHGVSCSRRHNQRVTKLNLQSQNLVGFLSPNIGNLSFLRVLELQNNSFDHEIPPQIGRLHRLQVLQLNNNSLTGPIPYNISYCSNLTILNFGHNMLVGKIPSEVGSFSKLQVLVLQGNNLMGEVPPSLGNLSSLKVLAATSNNLVGSIPSSLGQLEKLTFLSVGLNKLSGTIPPSIYSLSALRTFAVYLNRIQGSLPLDLGKTLPNLQIFSIGANQFSGSIPISLSNATSIRLFQVQENKLTGQVPDVRKLHDLQTFTIQENHLGSSKDGDLSFLSDLTNATELKVLIIEQNKFGGMLPTSISNLSTKLEQFWLYRNQLHGSIPADIGNLINLQSLGMGENSFTGNIPAEIQKLSNLEELDISMNLLSGSIPSSLGNLTKLYRLFLEGNDLQGVIPSSLGECQRLIILDISDNKLSGSIPRQVIGLRSLSKLLNFSNNHFTGSLPMEVGNLRTLGKLDASNNMLSGELPSTLGKCESLEILHLQGNFFQGPIPSSMIGLKAIEELDLSRNNLSGEIPKFLEGFVFLNNLNLSFNEFRGAIPAGGVFKNASAISIAGNSRLCGGTSNLQLPKCRFKKGRSSYSLKLIIPLALFGLALLGIAMAMSYLFLCSSRKKRKEISLSILANSFLQVSYAILLKATDGFSSANLIGVGSFGSVYKGVLDDDEADQILAVKVFNLSRHGAPQSFIAECEALRNIKHRNLVKIITVCSSVDFLGNDFKALVYEYMDKGSLEEWLHPPTEIEEVREAPKTTLNLHQRLDIAIDVACALDYLHNYCETTIVHCDLKPSNVLLNNELTGHVSDFGLARFLPQITSNLASNQTSSIGIRGTVGYAPPEYGMGSAVSRSGDVYSFGILLLEMFTGKRPTDDVFSDGLNLHIFVKMALPDRVTEIADSPLFRGTDETPTQRRERVEKTEVCLSSIFRLAIACSTESPTERLSNISDAASELHSIRDILLG